MCEIGCPKPAGCGALAEIDRNRKLGLLKISVRSGLVELRGAAPVAANGKFTERDVDGFGINLSARVADRCHQASPVRIASGPSRFDERRAGNRFCDAKRVSIRRRALNAKFDDVRHTLAVGDNLACQRCADAREGRSKLRIGGADPYAAGAGGEKKDRVVGGGISINRDAIETDVNCFAEIGIQHHRLNGGVREDVDQHGGVRHDLGVDHTGALAKGCDADLLFDFVGSIDLRCGYLKASKGGLLDCVRGEDGLSHLLEMVGPGADGFGQLRQNCNKLLGRKRYSNHSGRRRDDFFGYACEGLCSSFACGASGVEPCLPDSAVGIAGVDGYHTHLTRARTEMLRAHDEGRSLDAITGESRGRRGRRVRNDQREISAAALLQARLRGAKTKATRNHKLGEVAHRSEKPAIFDAERKGINPFNLTNEGEWSIEWKRRGMMSNSSSNCRM